jgi:O-antigen/teichoic acid export membrane protein
MLFFMVIPVFTAVLPRLSRLLAQGEHGQLIKIYSQASQVMAVTVLPAAATLAFFSDTILRLWTGDQAVASAAALPLTLLAAGNAANALINLPYTLRLASGSLRPVVIMNLTATLLMVPLVWFLIAEYGAAGGAGAWLVVNMLYLVVGVPIMHTGLLDNGTVRWFVHDILSPLVAATFVVGLGRLVIPTELPWMGQVASIALTGMAAFGAAVTVSNTVRSMVLRVVTSRST